MPLNLVRTAADSVPFQGDVASIIWPLYWVARVRDMVKQLVGRQ